MANTTVEAKTTKEIKDIPLEKLVETPENEYIFGIDDSEVAGLAREIEEVGFLGSIDVIDMENGFFQIVTGHQRFRAMQKLGRETIPCMIYEKMTRQETYRRLIASNVLTRKLTPLSYARAIEAYKRDVIGTKKRKNNEGSARKEIATFFGVGEGQVQRYEAILRMPKYLQDLCVYQDFPYSVLVEAVTLSDDQKNELADAVKNRIGEVSLRNITRGDISAMIQREKWREDAKKKAEEKRERIENARETGELNPYVISEARTARQDPAITKIVENELDISEEPDVHIPEEQSEDEQPSSREKLENGDYDENMFDVFSMDAKSSEKNDFDVFQETKTIPRNMPTEKRSQLDTVDSIVSSVKTILEGVVSRDEIHTANRDHVVKDLENCAAYIGDILNRI